MASYQFLDTTTGEIVPGFVVLECTSEEIEIANRNLERHQNKLRYVPLTAQTQKCHTLEQHEQIPA